MKSDEPETQFLLQINENGAWRNVVTAEKEQMADVEHHAKFIARIVGQRYKWRIIEAGSNRVIGYCQAPDFEWNPPARR